MPLKSFGIHVTKGMLLDREIERRIALPSQEEVTCGKLTCHWGYPA
jgi:hypothetical protein